MISKTIKYTDYNNEEREETFLFDLNKAELTEMELEKEGGLSNLIEKITKTKDVPSLIKMFKSLILRAYGEKSADGRRFIKSEELSTAFSQTPAYSILFMELVSDESAATAFINGILPQDMIAEQAKLTSANK